MKGTMPALLLALALLLLPASFAHAHGGGLDAYGGHNDRKHGGYHVHRGPLAGKSYPSKAAMMEELERGQGKKIEGGNLHNLNREGK
ncbi:hypothetical protein JCM15519_17150 [Fundidesulfovibrio butyratiphilus]